MINQWEDKINRIGIAFFVAIFFLIVSSFADTPVKHKSGTERSELVFGVNPDMVIADLVIATNLPAFHKKLVSSLDKTGFRLCNCILKVFSDNNDILRREYSLKRELLLTSQFVFLRFYYRLFSFDSGELPA
jgi:hypothetical protein